ncbi:GAF domain-containing protein [Desertivirga arenae]|uniref:GAF domain-containing protein n=1 Tax=Desertivirga arenae TaxID=2810309 RepID=UPI001A9643B5|nr:GAF domain-containing protein [Pedobacter sp. SYSU D00823]
MSEKGKEDQRLAATRRYLNFHINREKELEDITMLASTICQAPIALITLMDEDVQFINAQTGADIREMPRKTSFCTHAIEQDTIMEVKDASLDIRFADAPVVANDPHIRFYASANLRSYDGYNVGTLCVYDVSPKILTEQQKQQLEVLAKQVSHIMELDRTLKQLQAQNDILREIAWVQSHELRSPVSAIIGLVAAFKENDYAVDKEYFLLLEEATIQLDEKIRMIVDKTNSI